MERIHVLALSFLFPNASHAGYGLFVFHRIKAVARFCAVRVIAPVQWYPLMRWLARGRDTADVPTKESIDGIEVFHPRFFVVPRYLKWFDCVSYLWAASRVAKYLEADESFRFDLIDVHWTYPDVVAGYYLARKRGKKFIVTVRGHEALYDREFSIRRLLVAHFLRRADHVVALSAELRERVVRLGVPEAKSSVVLNGVDVGRFHYMDRNGCRAALKLPMDSKILISVGRLTEGKGHQELVRAMPLLGARGAFALYLIGGVNREDDYTEALRRMISELALNNVTIVDDMPQKQLALWYGAADVFCLASRSEGCPNVVLEALASGTPVVATNTGAVGEFVKPGENGFLVSGETTLVDALKAALERDWDRREIASAMEGRTWRACAESVYSLYQSTLKLRESKDTV